MKQDLLTREQSRADNPAPFVYATGQTSRWPRWQSAVFVCFALLFSPAAAAPASLADEIQAFATLLTLAKTASDRCTDILVNTDMLDTAPAFFHMAQADQATFQKLANAEMDLLAAAIEVEPSVQAWCDEAYRHYGPEGDLARDLLKHR